MHHIHTGAKEISRVTNTFFQVEIRGTMNLSYNICHIAFSSTSKEKLLRHLLVS